MDEKLLNFEVQIYGNLVRYDDTKSLARCRIFYKYENRNGTYITDEFADKLVASLPYAPIKGIYDYDEEDFTDHGKKRSLGRIYGVVPANNNFAWEPHTDTDGVERTYACTDVLIYTALYKEAASIVGKPQSMELYPESVKGSYQLINGQERYVYTDGCFLGLQILGKEIEPCFEGADFYSLTDAFKSLLNDVYQYDLNNKKGGQTKMPELKFNTEEPLYSAWWGVVNPLAEDAETYTINTNVLQIGDQWYTNPIGDSNFYQYTLNTIENEDGTKNYSLSEDFSTYEVILATHDEKAAIEAMKEANGGSYDNLVENFVKKEELEQKTLEFTETISTLTTERDESVTKFNNLQAEYDNLKAQFETLANEKAEYELKQKNELIDKYSKKLDEAVINRYKENLSTYTVIDLNKNLAYELVENDASIFSNDAEGIKIPKEDKPLSNIEAALSKHLK